MGNSSSLLIISDLHIGCGALDDFDGELEGLLAAFLAEKGAQGPVELVINGDFLDFVQAPPFQGSELEAQTIEGYSLCFTESQSAAKLAAILDSHQATLEGLRSFLDGCQDNRIVILAGNHDADFYWGSVREQFIAALAKGPSHRERVRFHLERVYRPECCPTIWIEHGQQYDPVNSFFLEGTEFWSQSRPPIWKPAAGSPRLIECTGTRFLIRYLNGIDERYPFVDNVKPFSRFIKIFGASAIIGSGGLRVALTMAELLRFLATTVYSGNSSDLLSWERDPELGPAPLLIEALKKLSDADRKALRDRIRAAGFPLDSRPVEMVLADEDDSGPLLAFLAQHPELVADLEEDDDGLLSADGDDPETLALAKGFRADETGDLKKAAAKILNANPDVRCVVMGHTHEPVNTPEARYLNTGSWTRYYRFAAGDKTESWKVLKTDSFLTFPYELNYVETNSAPDSRIEMRCYRRRDHA
jgi:UDP-2,3-diacylglucosamine pyrophosphatase LpxH